MTDFPDFFSEGYKLKWDKDVFHYLDSLAKVDKSEQNRALAHRVIRGLIKIYPIKDKNDLEGRINSIISELQISILFRFSERRTIETPSLPA